jgi:hypothetical protein
VPVKVSYVGWLCLGAPIGADTPEGRAFVAKHYQGVINDEMAKFDAARSVLCTSKGRESQHLYMVLGACVVATSFSYLIKCCAFDARLTRACSVWAATMLKHFAHTIEPDTADLTPYECACFAAQVPLPVGLGGFGGILGMALWAPAGAAVATQNSHLATAKDLFA